MTKVLTIAVSKAIVLSTVKGSVDHLGRRGAVVMTKKTIAYSMAVGGHAAYAGVELSKLK